MSEVANSTVKTYSADKKLWLNMTREEAYKAGEQTLKLFNYADKDGDKKISQKELNRYNSPVVIENYEEVSNSRVVTQGKVKFNSLFVGEGNTSLTSQIITNKEEEFYAGLELKDVSSKGSEIFYAMDMNHYGYLSKGEMKISAEIKSRTNKAIKQVKEAFDNVDKKAVSSIKWSTGIGSVGLAGAIAISEEGALSGAAVGGLVGAIIGAVVGLGIAAGVSYFGGKSVDKESNYDKIFNDAMGNLSSHSYAKYAKETFMKAAKAIAEKYFE